MDFLIKSGSPEKQKTACLVVGVFEPRKLSAAAGAVDTASGGRLSRLLKRGDQASKRGQTLMLHELPGVAAERVLLVGCGPEREFGDRQYREAVAAAVMALGESGASEALCCLTELQIKGRDSYWKVRQAVEVVEATLYEFKELKTEKKPERRRLRKLALNLSARREAAAGERAIEHGGAVAAGVALARRLGNLPANICTPSYLAAEAQKLARGVRSLKVTVLTPAQMEKLGMGALLSVAKGSVEPARLIVLEYFGTKRSEKPHVLVGKGVTFDSGGISIKPAPAMDEMKFDMCGAASVLGTLHACARMQLPLNVIGIVPACENLPSGSANKPGDIVTSMAGITIEVLNTDAEGRLLLCDALSYAERYQPQAVIDVATLTGACVIALGKHASGLMTNHAALGNQLVKAGQFSGDRIWELPLWDEYQEQLKTNFADVANVGGRDAGTITAACFLARFTKKYHWAHLDIAGTAWLSGERKGATGRPVPLLTQYLLDRVT